MLNIRELESLRTKEELINYFKENGQNITEEEIETLKKSYEQAQKNGNTLTMQQLEDVAGGVLHAYMQEIKLRKRSQITFFGKVNIDVAHEYKLNRLEADDRDDNCLVVHLQKQDGQQIEYKITDRDIYAFPFFRQKFENAKKLIELIQEDRRVIEKNWGEISNISKMTDQEINALPEYIREKIFHIREMINNKNLISELSDKIRKEEFPKFIGTGYNGSFDDYFHFIRSTLSQIYGKDHVENLITAYEPWSRVRFSENGNLNFYKDMCSGTQDSIFKPQPLVLDQQVNTTTNTTTTTLSPSSSPVPQDSTDALVHSQQSASEAPHFGVDKGSNNDLWYALTAGALCVAGIVATGVITSAVNKDDNK